MSGKTWTVLVTDRAWPDLEIERAVLEPLGVQLVEPASPSVDDVVALAPEADAILNCWLKMPAEVLDAAPACRIVSRYGIGLDSIPVSHATALGMVVTNVPDFCLDEVSDHALALLLAAARGIVRFSRETAAGAWVSSGGVALPRLRGQTLGIVGYGNIGRRLAPKARALGLEIRVFSRNLAAGSIDDGVLAVDSLEHLLAGSDYVSLHCPATPETRGMIGDTQLRTMRRHAWLINTSRGALIDEDALLRALDEGSIAGAALDVMAIEPAPADHPLLRHPRTIVTPHVAFASAGSVEELRRRAAEHVAYVLRGERPPHVVNPDVLATPGRHGIPPAS